MTHPFSFTYSDVAYYFLWDIESGSLHIVDYETYLVSKKNNLTKEEVADYNNLNQQTIKEIEEELLSLEQSGLINMSKYNCKYNGRKDIKALCLNICHDCNFKCDYCFGDEGTYNTERDYMSKEVAFAAVDFLIENSVRKSLEIDFFGGEPLMNMDTVKATVEYANAQAKLKGKEFHFTITTNGLLLDEENIKYINEHMYNVVLSIDGRECVHNKVRRTVNNKDTYSIIMPKFIEFAKARKDKQYYVRGTFTHNNLDFASDILHLNDMGFDQISIEPVVLPNNHPLAIQENDIDKIKSEYEKLAREYLDRRKSAKTWFNFFHFMIDLEHGPCITKRLTGCGSGSEYLAISPLGDIYPCHQFVGEQKFKMGNVLDKTFDSNLQDTFRQINVLDKEECQDCIAKYYCSGGCVANSHHYMGSLTKPYTGACEMMKKRMELSLAIYAIENYLN